MQNEDFSRKWLALIGLSLLSFTAFLDYTIVTAALPFIQKGLNATVLQLQWILNIYGMILCMFMIAVGHAADLLGRRNIFYFGLILFAFASLGAGFSPTIHWLIFLRAIQGFAAAIIFTVGVALLPQTFPANQQTRAVSIFSAFNGAGLAIGPFLSGILISWLSWRWIFWINFPIIAIGMFLCLFSLKSSPKINYQTKFDWYGLGLLIVGLGCLVYGIIHGEQAGWSSIITYTNILIGIVALTLLIFIEMKIAHPLLDLTLFKNPQAGLVMLVCAMAGYITFVFMFFDSLYLEMMRHQTAFLVGLTLLSVPIVQVLVSLGFEPLVKKFGVFNLLLFGLGTAVLAGLIHAFFTPSITIYFVLIGLILLGYTWGIANAGSIAAITQSIPAEKTGGAIGTVFTIWNISGSIFLALATVVFHWRENVVMNSELAKANVALTAEQHQQITLFLSDPNQAKTILSEFANGKANEVFQAFHFSFMSGFHWVAWLSTVIMLIVLLAGIKLRQ